MLSSRFLALSFLYIFYATGLVAADPRNGDQNCQLSVRTVTQFRTVTHTSPAASSPPSKSSSTPPSVVTQNPGNVNLGNGNNNGNNNNGGNNKNGGGQSSSVNNRNNKPNTKTTSSVRSTASPPPASTNNRSLAASPSSTSTPPPSSTGTGDPSSSLTLDSSVIQNINGKAQGDGQIDSLVSTNNFINYCVGKTITNGQQVKTGSCNPTPMGDLPSVDNMPSAKFNFPRNLDTLPANTAFNISLQVNNLVTGTFTNAANTYFAAPQHLVNGLIQGHSHVVVQPITSLDSTQPLDPKVFAFFKGLNIPATNGVLTTTVTNGLPVGFYRVSSIVAAGNHQEATGPVAQRGSFNDAVYITVSDNGQNANNVPPSSTPPADSTSSTVPPDSSSSSVPSSSLSSPPVSSTSDSPNNSDNNGGKDNQTSPTDSLPASTSSTLPDVPPTSSLPVPTGNGGENNNGKDNGGKNNSSSSSEPPVPSSTGGENGGKQGDPTSTTPLATPSPSTGDDKSGTKQPNGGKGPQNDNGSNSKRMQRRSRLA